MESEGRLLFVCGSCGYYYRSGTELSVGDAARGHGNCGVGYGRASATDQKGSVSLDRQREKILALVESLGIEIMPDGIIGEVGSGADRERPGLRAVRDLVVNGEVGYILMYSADRLSRDSRELQDIVRECQEFGVELRFAEDYE